mgnify:CR=1 FL=1
MKTYFDCIPCFVRQTLDAARMSTDDPTVQERILRDVLRLASEMRLSDSPPAMAKQIHARLRELTGNTDPYATVKKRFNRLALEMLPELRDKIANDTDPLQAAVRLSIAGNIIDFGPKGNTTEQDARDTIAHALDAPLHGDMDAFRRATDEAEDILYLCDNAGEIVFDRLLVEQLGAARVTVAVRGAPVINDASMEDAQAAGLTALTKVISNGSDAPGTLLDDCSEAFHQHFHTADLIIAKGQGNFETLSEEPANVFFLFKVKCPVIAAHAHAPLGAQVLLQGHRGLSPKVTLV